MMTWIDAATIVARCLALTPLFPYWRLWRKPVAMLVALMLCAVLPWLSDVPWWTLLFDVGFAAVCFAALSWMGATEKTEVSLRLIIARQDTRIAAQESIIAHTLQRRSTESQDESEVGDDDR